MKLIKIVSVCVALAGLFALAVVVAPAVHDGPFGSSFRFGARAQERRGLPPPAFGGVEIGVSVRDGEAADKTPAGVIVEDVRPGSAAERAGLKQSDIVTDFDGERVRSTRQFSRLVQESAPGGP